MIGSSLISGDVNPGRNGHVGLNDNLVVGNVPQKVGGERRGVGDEGVVHLFDEVGEEQRRPEIRRPRRPVGVDGGPGGGGLDRHPPDAVPVDGDLVDLGELALHLHDLDPLVGAGEHVVDDGDAAHDALDGLEEHEGVAEEEGVGDGELHGVLGDDARVVHVGVDDARLREAGELQVDPHAAEAGGLVVAVDAGDEVGLPGDEDAGLGGEDDHVGDGVVVAGEGDGGAREGALAGVSAGGDVLPEVRVADVGLVPALGEDPRRVEVGDVAVVDASPEGVGHLNSAASVVGVKE